MKRSRETIVNDEESTTDGDLFMSLKTRSERFANKVVDIIQDLYDQVQYCDENVPVPLTLLLNHGFVIAFAWHCDMEMGKDCMPPRDWFHLVPTLRVPSEKAKDSDVYDHAPGLCKSLERHLFDEAYGSSCGKTPYGFSYAETKEVLKQLYYLTPEDTASIFEDDWSNANRDRRGGQMINSEWVESITTMKSKKVKKTISFS